MRKQRVTRIFSCEYKYSEIDRVVSVYRSDLTRAVGNIQDFDDYQEAEWCLEALLEEVNDKLKELEHASTNELFDIEWNRATDEIVSNDLWARKEIEGAMNDAAANEG